MNKNWIIIILVVIVLIGLCVVIAGVGGGLYFLSQQRTQTNSPTATWTISPEPFTSTLPVPAVSPSLADTPTVQPQITQSVEKTPNVDFNGISFYLDPRLAQGILPEIIPAAPGDATQSMAGEVHPEYTQFTLQGYILENTFHAPCITIYPLTEYRTMDSSADEIANQLTQLLAERPSDAETLPFLPLWNAAQMFHTQMKYVDFKNGTGVRFLTQYGQAFYPVNNHDLFYTFQGITEDGLWYISAVLPAFNPLLPASYAGGDPGIKDPAAYFAQVSSQLSALGPDSFTPDLLMLDELVGSLQVH